MGSRDEVNVVMDLSDPTDLVIHDELTIQSQQISSVTEKKLSNW